MKTEKLETLGELEEEADRLFSLLVRQDAANEIGLAKCVTCGSIHHWRKMDCGHFMSRRHKSTRFDKKNTGIQCKACNIFDQGKQFEFSRYLDKKHGEGTAENTMYKSKMTTHRTRYDYEYLIKELKNELKSKGYELR